MQYYYKWENKRSMRGNEHISLVEGNIYKYNSDLGIFINELRIFEIDL